MRVGRAITLWMGVCLGSLAAQDCPPRSRAFCRMATLAGTMDAANCQLSDRTPYAAYRLDLPVRGQIKVELGGNTSDFSLRCGTLLAYGWIPALPCSARSRPAATLCWSTDAPPAQTGNYTVNTSFTSEPGILCSNFPNIGLRQTLDGSLRGSGCLAFDGTPYEAYTLTTDGAGTLTVSASSPDFTPVIAVRSIDGLPLTLPSASPMNVVL